jgi:hypothetical protein
MADDDPVKFNISSPTDTQRFRQFIDDLRVRLRDESRPYVMQDAMRLRQQEDDPTGWLNLELSTSEHTVTLRLRTDNLYVVGFRNGAGTWFELRHNDGHASRIPESTALRVSEGRFSISPLIYLAGAIKYQITRAFKSGVGLWRRPSMP